MSLADSFNALKGISTSHYDPYQIPYEALKNMLTAQQNSMLGGAAAAPNPPGATTTWGYSVTKIDNGLLVSANYGKRRQMYAKDTKEVGEIITSMLVADKLEDK